MNPKKEKADLREEILFQANKLFQIFGYHKLVMEDIARAVGKSRGTLYLYFKDKDAIFNAIIEKEIEHYLAALTDDLQNHSTASDKLKAYFRIKFEFRHAKAAEYLTLNQELLRDPGILEKMRVYSDSPEIDHLVKVIQSGIADKEFQEMPQDQILLTARIFISALHGIANEFLADVPDTDLSPVKNLTPQLFLRSLLRT